MEICINTDEEMIPGRIYSGFINVPAEVPIAFKCIRTCTLEEYLNFVKENNLSHMVKRSIHDKRLYLVEVLD